MNARSVPSINALYPSINGGPSLYYNEVIRAMRPPKGIGIILVAHSYETVFALAASVSRLGNLRGVILKNSTSERFPAVGNELTKAGIPVLELTKSEMVQRMDKVAEQINQAVPSEEPFVLMDHGGYFAFEPDLFQRFPSSRLIGVAEHTLNGEERYKSLNLTDRPIISIGQSIIKLPSDEAAADAIILASDGYLQAGGINLNSKMHRVGIIGYGRLGGRIGRQLSSKDIQRVLVNDKDVSKITGMRDHSYADKELLCQKCNVIFCATGSNALQPEHYNHLKNNTIIFTVTSPDDELRLDRLVKDGVLIPMPEKRRGDTFVYKVAATGNEIILPYNGESPNTSLPYGIADPVIHQTYAAHIAAAISVMRHKNSGGLYSLSSDAERTVSELWMKHFGQTEEFEARAPVEPKRKKSAVAPVSKVSVLMNNNQKESKNVIIRVAGQIANDSSAKLDTMFNLG